MRGRVKKLLSTALALLFLLALLPGNILAADVVASGDCGAYGGNVTWTLDGSGLLTISGTGAMANYSHEEHNQPWGGMLGIIKSLKIEPGVKEAEMQRLMKVPSRSSALPSTGSVEGTETMPSSSPVR